MLAVIGGSNPTKKLQFPHIRAVTQIFPRTLVEASGKLTMESRAERHKMGGRHSRNINSELQSASRAEAY